MNIPGNDCFAGIAAFKPTAFAIEEKTALLRTLRLGMAFITMLHEKRSDAALEELRTTHLTLRLRPALERQADPEEKKSQETGEE